MTDRAGRSDFFHRKITKIDGGVLLVGGGTLTDLTVKGNMRYVIEQDAEPRASLSEARRAGCAFYASQTDSLCDLIRFHHYLCFSHFIPLANPNRGSILFEIFQSGTQPGTREDLDERIDPLFEFISPRGGIKNIYRKHFIRMTGWMTDGSSIHLCLIPHANNKKHAGRDEQTLSRTLFADSRQI